MTHRCFYTIQIFLMKYTGQKTIVWQEKGMIVNSMRKTLPKRENIASGTTDPEIDFVTWIEFSNNMALIGISRKFAHQMAPLALVANMATRWHHLHKSTSLALPHCLELPSWHYQPVLSWYLHQPESHQLSQTKRLTDGLTCGPNYRTPGLPGSDKNWIGTKLN